MLSIVGIRGRTPHNDPAWTQHLQLSIGVVGDGHELRVARTSHDVVVGSMKPDHLEGEGLCPKIGWIPKGDG